MDKETIITRIFCVGDSEFPNATAEECIFYKNEQLIGEYYVSKSRSNDKGFHIDFYIMDEEEENENVIKSFEVRTIADLYEAVRIIDKFTYAPYKAIERLD